MKRLIISIFVLALAIFAPTTLRANEINVTIDGTSVDFAGQPPVMIQGRTLVPIRGVFESLGFDVDWHQAAQTAILTRADYTILITIGSATFTTNGASHDLDVPAQIIGGRTMLPIRAVLESANYAVDWNSVTHTVVIDSVAREALIVPRMTSTIAAGTQASFIIRPDGALWAWGENSNGQLGDGTTNRRYNPVEITDNLLAVTTGNMQVAAIRQNGDLLTWGTGHSGQIGDGYNQRRFSPTMVMENVAYVSSGLDHHIAITTDGRLWAWGGNSQGQLGDGTTEVRLRPTWIMDDVVAVSAGWSYTMAIRADGSLWAWGGNRWGNLGDGTQIDRHRPVRIKENVRAVSAGNLHTMAITTDNALWAWGDNSSGQFGNGTRTSEARPVWIMGNVSMVSTCASHAMAITTNNVLWTWGYNGSGQLGDGTTTDRLTPVAIMDNTIYISTAGGGWAADRHSWLGHSLAIRTDGSLWGWGGNIWGQLGVQGISFVERPTLITENVMLP